MRSATCLFDSAFALQRVFSTMIKSTTARTLHRPALSIHRCPRLLNHTRVFSSTPAKHRFPRDDEILAKTVRLVGKDGHVGEAVSTAQVRTTYDKKTHYLLCMALPDDPKCREPPICKIMAKKALVAIPKKQATPSNVIKLMEVNWAIDQNDLSYRLKQIKKFLEKGTRVHIQFVVKKKGKTATLEDANYLLQKIRETILTVKGAREARAMKGKLLDHQTVFYMETKLVK